MASHYPFKLSFTEDTCLELLLCETYGVQYRELLTDRASGQCPVLMTPLHTLALAEVLPPQFLNTIFNKQMVNVSVHKTFLYLHTVLLILFHSDTLQDGLCSLL